MTREEYRNNLRAELADMDKDELKAYAKKNYVRLYSSVPDNMVSTIVEAMTNREFHGDAFRDAASKMDKG